MTVKFHRRMVGCGGRCLSTFCALTLVLSLTACREQVPLEQPVGTSGAPLALHQVERKPDAAEPSRAEPEPCEDGRKADRPTIPNRFSSCNLPTVPAGALLFSTGSKALRPRGQEIVDDLVDCMLRGTLRDETILVRGYTDPRGSDEYNMELAEGRAATVRRYLVRRGVSPDRVRLAPVGEEKARGYGPESWQLDRRVEISVLPQDEVDANGGL